MLKCISHEEGEKNRNKSHSLSPQSINLEPHRNRRTYCTPYDHALEKKSNVKCLFMREKKLPASAVSV